MRAVDTSRYATGNAVPPHSFYERMKADGIGLFIPGAWHGTEGYDQVETALKLSRNAYAQLTATYCALSPGRDGADAVRSARSLCGDEWSPLSFCAVDVETDGITLEQIGHAVEEVVAQHQRPIIYTSASRWAAITSSTRDFAWVPLWNANYNGIESLFFAYPYGGWTAASLAGEQYLGDTPYSGVDVDFSVFSDAFVQRVVSVPDPFAALVGAWKRDMADLAANAASCIDPPLDLNRLALHTVYTDARNVAWRTLLSGGK